MALKAVVDRRDHQLMARTGFAPLLRKRPARRLERGISVRAIDLADAEELSAFYMRLSPESRRLRFLGSTVLTPDQARQFAEVDGVSRQGFVAVLRGGGPRDGAIVGHVCLEPTEDDAAEVAIAVEDAFQQRGIGRDLLTAAVEWARSAGVHRLQASMFIGNVPIYRLLAGAGLPYRVRPVGVGLTAMELSLPA
jgi:acetyltransferase